MIKILTVLTLAMSLGFAKMIGGIAMTVDNAPITLAEIKTFEQQNKLSKEDAINALVQKKLEEEAIAQAGIYVNPLEVDKEVEFFAKKNGVDVAGLKAELAKRGTSFDSFKADIAAKLKRDKLYKKIIAGRLKKPDDATLKAYYDSHKKEFKIPGDIKVIEYHAKKGELLQAKKMQPMLNVPDIHEKERRIEATKVNPRLFALLLQTPTQSFTQIIKTEKDFMMFFVKGKSKDKMVDFEKAKQNIFARVMQEKEQALLIEYFEKKKSEAIIKVIRKP